MEFKSGDIILYRNEFKWNSPITWLAAAIRFFTGVKYNHAAIVVMSWEVPMINESLGTGVRSRPLDGHLLRQRSSIVVLRSRYPLDERAFCIRANSQLGKRYNFKGFIDQLIYRVTGKWTGHTRKFAKNAVMCTQYVAWCIRRQQWWKYSCAELLDCAEYKIIYEGTGDDIIQTRSN
jgi:hypothetical protein